jgi:hypothetical protein
MTKRKSELRCSTTEIQIAKIKHKSELWNIIKLQPFFPPIECLFKTEKLDKLSLGIKFSPILDAEGSTLKLSTSDVQVHPKITMLISPYKWMKGGMSMGLPMSSEIALKVHQKLQSHNNAGYVGSILAVVLSKCQHFPRIYGVFTGLAKEHTIDISDDYEDLCDESWFTQNIGKTFDLKIDDEVGQTIQYSRKARINLELGEDVEIEGIQELNVSSIEAQPAELKQVFQEEECHSETSSVSTSELFEIDSMSSSFDESWPSEEDDEPFAWATFKDVPVQLTIMEKLEGTFYELLKDSPHEKHLAWIGQIIFALAFAQRNFSFTHNDLHGNNIMFIQTQKEFLYYSTEGKTYKLPTYGYLLKIIDFDRGIGSIKLQGMKEPRVFMSDQFNFCEEAGGQYNCSPFFTPKAPPIKPNPSFDLTRLATALFWDIYPEGPKYSEYQNYPVFKLFMKWMTLDEGSVLFFKNNPKIDRFIGFSLYKAIAKYSKNAIPQKEIQELSCFLGECPLDETPLIIED